MPTFTNTNRTYALLYNKVPESQWDLPRNKQERTEPTVYIVQNLSRAESGANHMHSVGTPSVIRWKDDGEWKPLACHYCGSEIRYVQRGWYHDPHHEGIPASDIIKTGKGLFELVVPTLDCPGTIAGTTRATPVAPVQRPTARTPQQTLTALLDYTQHDAVFGDRIQLSGALEPYLRDRYADLRESGRIFAAENEPIREQHNHERHYATRHFNTCMWRLDNGLGEYTRMPVMKLREMLQVAARMETED